MSIAALLDVWMAKEDVVYIYNVIMFSHEKEGNPAFCDKVDGT